MNEEGLELAKKYCIPVVDNIVTEGMFKGEHVETLVFYNLYLHGQYNTMEGLDKEDKDIIVTFKLDDTITFILTISKPPGNIKVRGKWEKY